MDIVYRLGEKKDLDTILKFLKKRNFYSHFIGFEKPECMRDEVDQAYKDSVHIWEYEEYFPILIAEDLKNSKTIGYMLMNLGAQEAFRDQPLAYFYDYYIDNSQHYKEIMTHFIKQGESFAEEYGINRMVVDIITGNIKSESGSKPVPGYKQLRRKVRKWKTLLDHRTEEEKLFEEQGFHIEMNRIIKEVETFTFDTPLQSKYRVRPARESDRIFIINLVAQNSEFLILPHCEGQAEEIQQNYFHGYSEMDLTGEAEMWTLIGEDIENNRPVGYIMLQKEPDDVITAEKTSYLFDISVHRDYWGKYATQRLMREAENWLAKKDYKYIYADISERNPRPLKTAIKSLDYTLYSRRWAKIIENGQWTMDNGQ